MPEQLQIKEAKKFEVHKLNRRLDYAKYLLVQTAEPFEKIAANCGWTSEKAFISVFQKQVGVSPVNYRRWHQS
jgi:transcriptional regulator GlxA family with amidase domain